MIEDVPAVVETAKELPFGMTLIFFAVIQIAKIVIKRYKDHAIWQKVREFVPYIALLLGGIFSLILAQYYGYTNDEIKLILQDAFYVGGGAVTLDQLLKPLEKRTRSMFGLK